MLNDVECRACIFGLFMFVYWGLLVRQDFPDGDSYMLTCLALNWEIGSVPHARIPWATKIALSFKSGCQLSVIMAALRGRGLVEERVLLYLSKSYKDMVDMVSCHNFQVCSNRSKVWDWLRSSPLHLQLLRCFSQRWKLPVLLKPKHELPFETLHGRRFLSEARA